MTTVIRTLVYTGEPDRINATLARSYVRLEAGKECGPGLTITEIKREQGTVLHRWWFIRHVATGRYLPEGRSDAYVRMERGLTGNAMPRRFRTRRGAVSWIIQWLKGEAEPVIARPGPTWGMPLRVPPRPGQTLDPNGMFLWTPRPDRKREQLEIVSVDVLLP